MVLQELCGGHLEHIHTVYMTDGIHLPSGASIWVSGTAYLGGEDLVKAVNGVQDVIHLIECRCLILDSFGWISADSKCHQEWLALWQAPIGQTSAPSQKRPLSLCRHQAV